MESRDKRGQDSNPNFTFDDKYLFVGLTSGAIKNKEGRFVKEWYINKVLFYTQVYYFSTRQKT